jgi:hypothetical protein
MSKNKDPITNCMHAPYPAPLPKLINIVWPATSSIPGPRTTSSGNCWCPQRSLSECGCSIEGGRNELLDQLGVERSPNKQICRLHRHPREAARRRQKPEDPPQLPKDVPLFCSNNAILQTTAFTSKSHLQLPRHTCPHRALLELSSVQIGCLLFQ